MRSDGSKNYTAKLVGTDPQTDIAVLKIEADNLPVVTIADSDKIEVGDVVFAIGNPLGVGQSVTMGIVSAKGRSGFGMTEYEDFIQTDASINPGNSGGALVDAQGRLIGINTFIVSVAATRTRFCRPRQPGPVCDGSTHRERQSRPRTVGRCGPDRRSGHGGTLRSERRKRRRDHRGFKEGPGAKAGLEAGDVVVEIDGKEVDNHRELRTTVAQTRPGTTVRLKVIREVLKQVTPGALRDSGQTKAPTQRI